MAPDRPDLTRPPVLQARGLGRWYEGSDPAQDTVIGIRGVDLELSGGELVVLTGPSGCGKTTLLNLLGLVDRPDAGEILFAGRSAGDLSDDERALIRRRQIGTIYQFFHLLPHLSLEENVELPLLLDGEPAARTRPRAREILERLGLGGRGGDYPQKLSGGQLQRVAIARALMNRPALILADEPTGSLDRATGDEILGILQELAGEGETAVVMATHSPRAAAIGTRRIEITDGRVVRETAP